jgi:hypothetical protein
MNQSSATRHLRILLFVFLCLSGYSSFAQDTSVNLKAVSIPFIQNGVKCFKVNVRNGRRDKVTEQVTINYNTLKYIVDHAHPDSDIVFIMVAIDKDYVGSDSVWLKLNNYALSMQTLHNKQALIVKYINNPAVVSNFDFNNKQNDVFRSSSSLKFANNPSIEKYRINIGKINLPGFASPDSRYYALGKLCPPPVCPGY